MPAARPSAPRASLFSTRNLLYCAVFAAIQALFYLAVAPLAVALASAFPPAYALVAGVYSIMLFTARLFIGLHGAATLAALITGVLIGMASPVGFLVLVPLVTAAAVFDLVLYVAARRSARLPSRWTALLGAALSALALFGVSLPLFSADHLTVAFLTATLAGRVLGQVAAAGIALAVVVALARAGVRTSTGARREPQR